MDHREQLNKVRGKLDQIDVQLIELFEKRMEISDEIAEIKRKGNFSLTDEVRENFIIDKAVSMGNPSMKGEISIFMKSLMSLSKIRQRKLLLDLGEEQMIAPPREKVKDNIKIAYQGIPGAWGEMASIKMFEKAEHCAQESFETVFAAVKNKEVNYGIVPIENSHTGAIGEVYDLLRKYGCYIVGQTWISVNHCLMGMKGGSIEEIREVFSHPEGFRQCNQFLKSRSWDLTACRNTAVAAETVALKGEKRFAAIGSMRAAELNNLEILAKDIQSDNTNRTRFIVIADTPEYDEKSDIVSVIFRTAHRSGALCDVLFPFLAEGVNLSRIESRPMSGGKYCFFTDLIGNINDPSVISAIRQASASSDYLEVLGCYDEK